MKKDCQIIISESIEQVNDFSGNIINKVVQPVLTFKLPFVPSALTFHIMIVTTGYDYSHAIEFGFKITKVDTGELLEEQPVVMVGLPVGQFSNFNFNIAAKNVSIMKKGEYKVEVKINGDPYTHSFYVDAVKDHLENAS